MPWWAISSASTATSLSAAENSGPSHRTGYPSRNSHAAASTPVESRRTMRPFFRSDGPWIDCASQSQSSSESVTPRVSVRFE